MTGVPHDTHNAMCQMLPHPALQLLHWVLSGTFLCQGETTKVPLKDLQFLWDLTRECNMVLDWIGTFLKWAKKIGMTTGGKVAMGRMVTLLLQSKMSLTKVG